MKKRVASIVMSLIMAVSLTACENTKSVSSAETSLETSTEVSTEASVSSEVSVSEEVKEEVEVSGSIDMAKKQYESRGMFVDKEGIPADKTAEGTIYINKLFGFKAVPSGNFQFLSDEADEYIDDAAADFIDDTDSERAHEIADEMREEDTSGFYMADYSMLNTANAQIMFLGNIFTEKNLEFLNDESVKQMEEVFSGDTIKSTDIERTTTTFLGREIPCIKGHIEMETQGVTVDFYLLSVSLIQDGYLCTFSFGSYLEDNTDEIAEMILPLED